MSTHHRCQEQEGKTEEPSQIAEIKETQPLQVRWDPGLDPKTERKNICGKASEVQIRA